MLTQRQKQIFEYIKKFIKEKGYSPTQKEVGKHFGLVKSTVHQHFKALEERGYIIRSKNKARSIELASEKMIEVPLLGLVAAGEPIEPIENKESIAIPQRRLPLFGNVYGLRVKGDSMIDENINDGDIVLLKQQNVAQNGDKVVALIDNNEVTLKEFFREKGIVKLQPANNKMQPIIIDKTRELSIQGVLIDVIKNESPTINITPESLVPRKISGTHLLNKIYNEDCLTLMQNMKDETVDLIFADPPYNLSKSNFSIKFTKSGGSDLHTYKGQWDTFSSPEEYEIFTRKWLRECFRILKKTGAIWVAGTYHNIYLTGHLLQKLGFEILNEVLWHKSDATPNLSCTRFVADHENFIWARKGKKNIFNYKLMKQINGDRQMRSMWTKGKTTGGKKIHPTQKPEWLLERIILATSRPGDLVFDPFLGSGTTAVVAKRYKREYLGAEINKAYYELALKRIRFI